MIHVVKAGLQTAIQDWPGRIGFANQGFPISGPFDSWSFRLANIVVGNPPGTAGLECQFVGPTLKFSDAALIAVTGADMAPELDGRAVPMWESIVVKAGQTLALGGARLGARAYIAVAGGITNTPWLGSRSTFHQAGVGGIDGHALKDGQQIPTGAASGTPGRRVKPSARPPISAARRHQIEVVMGPNDDWIDEDGHRRFLSSDWKLTSKSDRTGFRLDGPQFTFTKRAYEKPVDNGAAPANIVDQGYPAGAINLAGQTPIILVADAPSMGGFINPYTVPRGAFWKLAQALPGHILNFVAVDVEAAQALARDQTALCNAAAIETA